MGETLLWNTAGSDELESDELELDELELDELESDEFELNKLDSGELELSEPSSRKALAVSEALAPTTPLKTGATVDKVWPGLRRADLTLAGVEAATLRSFAAARPAELLGLAELFGCISPPTSH